MAVSGVVLTFNNSTIANNSADDRGGGLSLLGTITINHSTISGNTIGQSLGFGGGRIDNSETLYLSELPKPKGCGLQGTQRVPDSLQALLMSALLPSLYVISVAGYPLGAVVEGFIFDLVTSNVLRLKRILQATPNIQCLRCIYHV